MASHAAPWRLFDWGDRLQSGGVESLISVRSALLRCFGTEDVLMLFRYTENPPENRLFGPGFLRLSGWRMGYTKNSSFPYTPPALLRLGPLS